ncbi:type VII secretion-associated serine protease mycosin [Gordonia sp. HY442]|uniref:type VII secretion-associated serine protease mycosin n=1 Tax=Gordonia zhenghanii TaxID=2911516 RepID=UPI001F01D6CA|nr:type VII secretion-associated serine protease mycosin [Gordonia zhenghanii]MCF8606419.1 type VII secretion-associated serine protease mycosin [Gordonia zhenghanii]
MRIAAAAAAALLALMWCPPIASAAPVPSATPLGPLTPTEQHARCARPIAASTTDVPPGHDLLDVAAAHQFSRGDGVSVAVIDTGVAPHRRLPGLVPGGDYVSSGNGLSDCDAHGTLVAGIIAARSAPGDSFVGVAPAARIISIRQSSGAFRAKNSRGDDATVGVGYGPLATLAKAVVRAVDLGADVVNISETACLPAASELGDDVVGQALQYALTKDVVVVVAAGNLSDATTCREQNPDPVTALATVATPARFAPLVITVGAAQASDGTAAAFSLRGPWVSVGAPGTDVVSIAPTADGPRPVYALAGADGPVPLAGTSYAAPYVAGVAALVRSRFPEMSAAQVIERIVATAHGGGHDGALGAGVVDPVAALTAHLPARPDPVVGHAIAAPAPPDPGAGGAAKILIAVALAALVLAVSWRFARAAAPAAGRTSTSPRRS